MNWSPLSLRVRAKRVYRLKCQYRGGWNEMNGIDDVSVEKVVERNLWQRKRENSREKLAQTPIWIHKLGTPVVESKYSIFGHIATSITTLIRQQRSLMKYNVIIAKRKVFFRNKICENNKSLWNLTFWKKD